MSGNYKRGTINATTPQDLKKINDNFMSLFQKVFGDMNFGDMDGNIQEKLLTYPIPINETANFDSSYPLDTHFYVPDNVSKIKSALLNVKLSNYRMDSGVAKSSNVPISVSGNTSTGTAGATISETEYVTAWGPNRDLPHPQTWASGSEDVANMTYWTGYGANPNMYKVSINGSSVYRAVAQSPLYGSGETAAWIDLFKLQHKHKFSLDWRHYHSMNLSIDVEGHSHDLDEAIKVSSTAPTGVNIYINSIKVGNTMSGDGTEQNNIDIASHIVIGQWNTVKVMTSNRARVSLYGVCEVTTSK